MKKTRLIMPNISNVRKTTFECNPWYNLMGMLYLNKKYNNNCVVIPSTRYPIEHTDISIRWLQTDGIDGYINIPSDFWVELEKHLDHSHDKRFIIFPFGFSCTSSGGHATYLIYDLHNQIMERFDSIGNVNSECLKAKDVDEKIKLLFKNKFNIKKYLKPFIKYKIFQELQDEENESLPSDPKYGFCSVWAIFWADLRLANPDIERVQLIKLALDQFLERDESLTEFIRGYSNNIVEFSKQYKKSKSIHRKNKNEY